MITKFEDLEFIFKDFFDINLKEIKNPNLKPNFPKELTILYKIREIYFKKNKIELFKKQDRLIPYNRLILDNPQFNFIIENQNCWTLQTEKSEPAKVYINQEKKIGLFKDFIITYVLQELTFSFEYVCYSTTFDDIKNIFDNIEPLWINHKYIYPDNNYNYYIVKQKGIALDIPEIEITFFGTNDETVFNRLEE